MHGQPRTADVRPTARLERRQPHRARIEIRPASRAQGRVGGIGGIGSARHISKQRVARGGGGVARWRAHHL